MIMHSVRVWWLQLALAGTLLGGCSLIPDDHHRGVGLPAVYPRAIVDADQQALVEWHGFFSDSLLQQLLAMAFEHNHDLRVALLRVEEARAAHGIQRSDRLPALGVAVQGTRTRIPADLSASGRSQLGSEYRAGIGLASWELDVWGRVRSLDQAALENWLATAAASHAARTLVLAEVADTYLAVRALEQRVAVARASVASRERSYFIFQRRYEAGATARLEVTQVHTLLTQAQSLLASLELQLEQQRNSLRLLAGEPAMMLLEQGVTGLPELPLVRAGLPSELLARRPDVVAAEHRLRAANANIGAARAAYLPRIALTGSYGTASAELDNLFASGSRSWTFLPSISLPIFDGGRRRAGLELSRVRHELALADYEKSIQSAFRDVADALAAGHWLGEQYQVQQVARDAQGERARLAELRYENGSAAYLEVLDAQRDLLEAEQQLIAIHRAVLANRIALYTALGGGYGLPDGLSSTGE